MRGPLHVATPILDRLPYELLQLILHELTDNKDALSLLLFSTRTCHALAPAVLQVTSVSLLLRTLLAEEHLMEAQRLVRHRNATAVAYGGTRSGIRKKLADYVKILFRHVQVMEVDSYLAQMPPKAFPSWLSDGLQAASRYHTLEVKHSRRDEHDLGSSILYWATLSSRPLAHISFGNKPHHRVAWVSVDDITLLLDTRLATKSIIPLQATPPIYQTFEVYAHSALSAQVQSLKDNFKPGASLSELTTLGLEASMIDQHVLAAVAQLPYLEKFDIRFPPSKISGHRSPLLSEIHDISTSNHTQIFPRLQHFSIRGARPEEFECFSCSLRAMTQLHSFYIDIDCSDSADSHLLDIFSTLGNLSTLRSLTIASSSGHTAYTIPSDCLDKISVLPLLRLELYNLRIPTCSDLWGVFPDLEELRCLSQPGVWNDLLGFAYLQPRLRVLAIDLRPDNLPPVNDDRPFPLSPRSLKLISTFKLGSQPARYPTPYAEFLAKLWDSYEVTVEGRVMRMGRPKDCTDNKAVNGIFRRLAADKGKVWAEIPLCLKP